METKAKAFNEIINVLDFNKSIDVGSNFYTNFDGLRDGFNDKNIFKHLNIGLKDDECNNLTIKQTLFLSGHRGTGKTTQLKKITSDIDKTKCFLSVVCDINEKTFDLNNIDFVDLMIFVIGSLVKVLEKKDIEIPKKDIESFYRFSSQIITEIENEINGSFSLKSEATAKVGLPFIGSLMSKISSKIKSSYKEKEIIRRVIYGKFSEFTSEFKMFTSDIEEYLKKEYDIKQGLLFVLDGFEKVGTFEDKVKILIRDASKFADIGSNIIISLPIELIDKANVINNYASFISFPFIKLDKNGIQKFQEFIYKRVDESLFESEECVKEIIKYGIGSPRETLRMVKDSFMNSTSEKIMLEDVKKTSKNISSEIVEYLTPEEIDVLNNLEENDYIPYSSTVSVLLEKKAILDYGDNKRVINPMILENEVYTKLKKTK